MENKKRSMRWTAALIMVTLALFAAGCGQGNTDAENKPAGAKAADQAIEPVTLKVFQQGASLSDEEFNTLMVEPIKKKFPTVTLELVRSGKGSNMEDLVSAGTFPDIVFSSAFDFYAYLDLGIPADLSGFIKKYQFDVNQFQPSAVQGIKTFGDKGQFYALPFSMNFSAIYYNKDIFDKLAIPYLKDGMNWNQLLDVAKQVAAKGGDQYHPLAITTLDRMSYNLQRVDLKTNKATLTGSDWVKVFQLVKEVNELPNNLNVNRNNFFKNKDEAIITTYGAGFLGQAEQAYAAGDSVKWDVISYPAQQTPGQNGVESQIHTLMVSATSKHQDAAFRVISYIAGNENIQAMAARQGRMPALNNKNVQDVFAADLKSVKGTNIQVIFKQKYAPNTHPTRYDRKLADVLKDAQDAVLKNGADINTALREAEEKANQVIVEMDNAKK